jgi:hypothetical protein
VHNGGQDNSDGSGSEKLGVGCESESVELCLEVEISKVIVAV